MSNVNVSQGASVDPIDRGASVGPIDRGAIASAVTDMLESRATTVARDLKLNFKRILEDGALDPGEAFLIVLATATAVEHSTLAAHAREQLAGLGFTAEQIQEAAESAALMRMLNTYYRFRHFVQNDDDYRNAGLRMTALARPALGKERFEMLAFAVSIVNGCETCVRSHEKALRAAGVGADKLHDAARLASVVGGLRALHAAG